MSEHDDAERTEEATPDKRRRAREEGQFPRARDTGAMAGSTAVIVGLGAFGDRIFAELRELMVYCASQSYTLAQGELGSVELRAARTLFIVAGPLVVAAALAATLAGAFEAGLHLRFDFKWERIEPLSKLRQLFSPKTAAVSTLLSLARVTLVAAVAYRVAEDSLPALIRLTRAPLAGAVHTLVDVVSRMALWSTLALGALTCIDYASSWWRHERDLRMTRQEIKEELHNQEGNPRVKARQRARARELLRRSIRKEVKSADVVVANPTHVSVALRYRPAEGAPVVCAKGYDETALYIRKLASENGIFVIENRPLARALAERVRVGRPVPVDLYAAVAEVLAMVYRLRQRGLRA